MNMSWNKIWTLTTLSIDTFYIHYESFNLLQPAKTFSESALFNVCFNFARMYQNVFFLVCDTFKHVRVDWDGFVADDDLESIQYKTLNM